ncbi:MAG: hypothetical protein WAX89_04265 [Alphaproteobacteria bacterium]
MRLTASAKARLDKLVKTYELSSDADAIRHVLKAFDLILSEIDDSAHLIVRRKDGSEFDMTRYLMP